VGIGIHAVEGSDVPAITQMLKDAELYDTTIGRRSGLVQTYDAILYYKSNHVIKLWIAYLDEIPVGVATLEEPPYYVGPVLNLFVKPPYRKVGIGSTLLQEAMNDGPFDVCHTDLSRGIYIRHGFQPTTPAFRQYWSWPWERGLCSSKKKTTKPSP
jgi:GNAT superfamily N-acetyltransferase